MRKILKTIRVNHYRKADQIDEILNSKWLVKRENETKTQVS